MVVNYTINVPILIIAFNRPGVNKETFEYIRTAKPKKLYIAIDGARKDKEGEQYLVEEVKTILENVDWQCETHYKYNNTNKGAEVTVSSAISWVLEKEEYAIIIEDDIVAPLSFLNFAQQMLFKYKDDERITTITGSNFTPMKVPGDTDYFFARYGHSGGGWATWRRAWIDFDLNVEIPKYHLKKSFLKRICNSPAEIKYYQNLFKAIKIKGPGNSTWDVIGLYKHRISNSLSIIPSVNLTSNIGILGFHANGETEHHFRPVHESFKVKNHPEKVECFIEYDKYHFEQYINKRAPLRVRALNKLCKILNINQKN